MFFKSQIHKKTISGEIKRRLYRWKPEPGILNKNNKPNLVVKNLWKFIILPKFQWQINFNLGIFKGFRHTICILIDWWFFSAWARSRGGRSSSPGRPTLAHFNSRFGVCCCWRPTTWNGHLHCWTTKRSSWTGNHHCWLCLWKGYASPFSEKL